MHDNTDYSVRYLSEIAGAMSGPMTAREHAELAGRLIRTLSEDLTNQEMGGDTECLLISVMAAAHALASIALTWSDDDCGTRTVDLDDYTVKAGGTNGE
ncbi:MAG: hypothetical protein LBI33_12750 [Propionibacteriaceae bacterium]|jgi:hypothetical protein|nr:hypothetical protein [Propionibacteriaceae bacterium]